MDDTNVAHRRFFCNILIHPVLQKCLAVGPDVAGTIKQTFLGLNECWRPAAIPLAPPPDILAKVSALPLTRA
jgi:hypothetical protein